MKDGNQRIIWKCKICGREMEIDPYLGCMYCMNGHKALSLVADLRGEIGILSGVLNERIIFRIEDILEKLEEEIKELAFEKIEVKKCGKK